MAALTGPIEESVEMTRTYPSVTDRYFTKYYYIPKDAKKQENLTGDEQKSHPNSKTCEEEENLTAGKQKNNPNSSTYEQEEKLTAGKQQNHPNRSTYEEEENLTAGKQKNHPNRSTYEQEESLTAGKQKNKTNRSTNEENKTSLETGGDSNLGEDAMEVDDKYNLENNEESCKIDGLKEGCKREDEFMDSCKRGDELRESCKEDIEMKDSCKEGNKLGVSCKEGNELGVSCKEGNKLGVSCKEGNELRASCKKDIEMKDSCKEGNEFMDSSKEGNELRASFKRGDELKGSRKGENALKDSCKEGNDRESHKNNPLNSEEGYKRGNGTRSALDSSGHTCIMIHTNKLCLITLSPRHPILALKKEVIQVGYEVGKFNRLDNQVSGKGKRGAQMLGPQSPVCLISCSDGSRYAIMAGVHGKLVEVNERLLDNPKLVSERPDAEGYLAVVLPPLRTIDNATSRLLNHTEYQALP